MQFPLCINKMLKRDAGPQTNYQHMPSQFALDGEEDEIVPAKISAAVRHCHLLCEQIDLWLYPVRAVPSTRLQSGSPGSRLLSPS